MHVTIIQNQSLSGAYCEDSSEYWHANYGRLQVFEIKVSAEHETEIGKTVGLNQTLVSSSRVATYAKVPKKLPSQADGMQGQALSHRAWMAILLSSRGIMGLAKGRNSSKGVT